MPRTNKKGKDDNLFKITTQKIGVESVVRKVHDIESGAVVLFIGTVRKLSKGKEVEYLEYEAYKEMALREFCKIVGEIKEKWNVKKIAIIHRTGKIKLGEASVVIAVSAPHRDEAFQASRYVIEKLKQTVPIWKKEVWEGGEEWIQGS
ncbi:MAG: molybdenum cofactor biosynthesis protein MoaE [Deltaproteobacteria bacterium]|nr:molybdenum cofactor biosynthesis protein MoaE [Deltaproteobacteria bacterium]